jgi:hypothetical protein
MKTITSDDLIQYKERSLQDKVFALDKVNRQCVEALKDSSLEEAIENIVVYMELKKLIKVELINVDTLRLIDPKALNIIRKVNQDEPLQADIIYKLITGKEYTGEMIVGEMDYYELDSLVSEIFHSWFSGYDYIQNLFEINSLILSVSVPKNLYHFVNRIVSKYSKHSCF